MSIISEELIEEGEKLKDTFTRDGIEGFKTTVEPEKVLKWLNECEDELKRVDTKHTKIELHEELEDWNNDNIGKLNVFMFNTILTRLKGEIPYNETDEGFKDGISQLR